MPLHVPLHKPCLKICYFPSKRPFLHRGGYQECQRCDYPQITEAPVYLRTGGGAAPPLKFRKYQHPRGQRRTTWQRKNAKGRKNRRSSSPSLLQWKVSGRDVAAPLAPPLTFNRSHGSSEMPTVSKYPAAADSVGIRLNNGIFCRHIFTLFTFLSLNNCSN